MSSQKVSSGKSKRLVSKNVDEELAQQLTQLVGIGITQDLGKYLGMPLLSGRVNKKTFFLIEKVATKTAG